MACVSLSPITPAEKCSVRVSLLQLCNHSEDYFYIAHAESPAGVVMSHLHHDLDLQRYQGQILVLPRTVTANRILLCEIPVLLLCDGGHQASSPMIHFVQFIEI